MPGPFHLERFVEAQAGIHNAALAELTRGRKASHWMWFIFPQLSGLGSSVMAQRFAISGKAEAAAYLAHPLLGARLVQCTQAVNAVSGRTAHEIFGSPDDMKFRSSMTLFETVALEPVPFRMAIDRYFGGEPDQKTLALLAES